MPNQTIKLNQSDEPLQVVIVDDHPFFRLGAKVALSSAKDVEVVADFDNCAQALDKIQIMRPDVVLMDISFRDENGAATGCNGIEATRQITQNAPGIRTIILTSLEEDSEAIFLSIRAGARGYLKKGSDLSEVLMAIRSVAQGGTYFGSGTARRIKDFFNNRSELPAVRPSSDPRRPFPELTESEFNTLNLLAQGCRNAEIADQLGLAEKTIRNYVSSILDKLQVSDRLHAALMANKAGLGKRETGE